MTTSPSSTEPEPILSAESDVSAPTRAELVIAAVAALVGSVLRFTPSSPLWLDEALTVNIASGDLGSATDLLRHDGHPPLYYWLQGWWIDLFGSSDAAVRSLSGVIGVATIALAWIVARRLFDGRTAAAVVVLVSLSPFAVRYSSEARMYALVMLLALLGLLATELTLERSTAGRLAAVSVVSGLLMLTHYWSFFLLGAAGLLCLIHTVRAPHADERRNALRLAVAIAAGGVLFLPWLGGFLDQFGSTGTPWAPRPRPTLLASETILGLGGGLSPESIILGSILVVLIALGVLTRSAGREVVLGLTAHPLLRRILAVTVVTLTAGAITSFVSDSTFAARYAAVYVPMVLLVAAAGIARLPLAATRVGLLLLVAALGTVSVAHDIRADRSQAGQIAATILERSSPGDVVVYCPDQLGPATERELGDAALIQYTFDGFGDPRLVDWVDYADRYAASDPTQFAADLAGRVPPSATIFIVWSDAYRSVDDRCSMLVDSLAAQRPGARQLLTGDARNFFENGLLHEFDPVTP